MSVQVGLLCEDCKRKRGVDERFDRDYATWKEQQQPGETFGLWWLGWRREEMGREIEMGKGEGDEKKGLEGRKE